MNPYRYTFDSPNMVAKAIEGYGQGIAASQAQQGLAAGAQDMEVQLEQLDLQKRGLDQQIANQDRQFGLARERLDMQKAAIGQQQAAAQQQADARVKMQGDLEWLRQNPSAKNYGVVMMRYPDVAKSLETSWELIDENRRDAELTSAAQLFAAIDVPEVFLGKLDEKIEAANNTGLVAEAANLESLKIVYQGDPSAARLMLGMTLKTLGGDDYDDLLGVEAEVQSSRILDNGTTLIIRKDGSRDVMAPDGEKLIGQEAADAIEAAQQFGVGIQGDRANAREGGTLDARIESGGEAAASIDAGKNAQKKGLEDYDMAVKTSGNIRNLDDAIAAIDAGAKTGLIESRVPTWNASTIELRSIVGRLGLDVVGQTTFGALSKGELDLALDVAIPSKMDEAELREWIVRKREIQTKILDSLYERAEFLLKPGNTIDMWLDEAKRRASERQGGGVDHPAPSPQAPDALQSLLNKYGGGN